MVHSFCRRRVSALQWTRSAVNVLWSEAVARPLSSGRTASGLAGPCTRFAAYVIQMVTLSLQAGHMVPTFQPAAALAFFERFLAAAPF